MIEVEVIGGFNYSALATGQLATIERCQTEIKSLLRRTVWGAVEIGMRLLEIKDCLDYGLYRRWIDLEFAWGKSAANRFEQVAIAFGGLGDAPIWDKFDLSALYELASDSASPARAAAIALAKQGEYISYTRAKALKSGTDTLCLQPGKSVLVRSGLYQGRQMTVRSSGSEGLLQMEDGAGGEVTLLISELQAEPTEQPTPIAKPNPPSQIEAIATELEIERSRVELLEGVLIRICTAARLGQLTDTLLNEAETLLV